MDGLFGGATVLRSKELEERGLSRTAIREALDAGRLERIGRGLYALPGAEVGSRHSLVVAARRWHLPARRFQSLLSFQALMAARLYLKFQ